MEKLIVQSARHDDRSVTLRDRRGRLHVARATSALPPLGADLWGYAPSLGFTTLFGATEGRVYRVIFEGVQTWPE